MGAPSIPSNVPPERLPVLGLRAKPGGDDSLEPETEWYFTDTGESVPSAVPEAPEE